MIRFYNQDGSLNSEIPFDLDNIEQTNGMLIKCYLKDGKKIVGYSCSNEYMTMEDNLKLWLWKDLGGEKFNNEQEFFTIKMSDIVGIDAILYSGPRWGGKLTNDFRFIPKSNEEIDLPPFLKESE